MDVRDKVVIVTGASRGIGRRIAIEFGARGAHVVVVARSTGPRRTLPGSLTETVELIEAAGGTVLAVACDVAEPADLERLVATTVEAFGGIDVIVNNAADMIGGDFEALIEAMLGTAAPDDDSARPSPLDTWIHQFAINVHAPYLLMTLATPHLRARGGGVVINITSGAAEPVPVSYALENPPPNPSLGYAVTKAALNRLTNAAAAQLAPDNIAVVAVDPGVVHTEVVDLFNEAGIPMPAGAPPEVPALAVVHVVTADDPMSYTGTIVRAQEGVVA